MTTIEEAVAKAREMGAAVKPLSKNPAWQWASCWPSPEAAREFVRWLDRHGIETKGYGEGHGPRGETGPELSGVLFRQKS